MGLEFPGQVPFTDVYVHSVIQAPDGRRMSKSLGTGIDPIDEIDRHGADAARFGLLVMSSTQDVRYSAKKIAQGEQLANKLFSASRLVLTRIDPDVEPAPRPTAIEDRWILSRLARAQAALEARIEAYDFSHAALALYDFVFSELCDWYLELIKGRPSTEELSATLLYVLRETLALAHPLMPFVTEEVWSYTRRGEEGLLAGHSYPRADEARLDDEVEAVLDRAIAAIKAIRAWRDEMGIAQKVALPVRLAADGYDEVTPLIARMAALELELGEGDALAAVPVPGGTIEVLAGEGVDLSAHERRLAKQREELAEEIARARGKLANAGFVAKAPPEVVEGERAKLARLEAELAAL